MCSLMGRAVRMDLIHQALEAVVLQLNFDKPHYWALDSTNSIIDLDLDKTSITPVFFCRVKMEKSEVCACLSLTRASDKSSVLAH